MSKMQTQVGFKKFTHDGATARLTLWDDGIGHVSGVYSRVRGQGHATQVMKDVCDYADDNGLLLQLEVSSYGPEGFGDGLTNRDLGLWYEKFGFRRVLVKGYPILMARQPISE